MIDYLTDIQPLESSLSDAEIANFISTRTTAPIDAPAARDSLLESGSIVVDPATGNRIGPLIDHYSSLEEGQDKVLLAWFLNYVFGDGTSIETNNYPRSAQFAAVEGGLPAGIAPVAASIVSKAGGRPDAGTVAADVSSVRELYLLEQQTQEEVQGQEMRYVTLYNQNIAPLIDANNPDDAAWQAALTNMATEWGN
tara:strand:+ start:323 stop:910 length:588 start_codon:yes stop_codon:yes gene_type:complete